MNPAVRPPQGHLRVLLGKIHRHALGVLKGDIGISLQIRLRHGLPPRQGVLPADVDAGGHGGNLMEHQGPGVQQAADDLLRQLRQKDHAEIRAVVVHIVDHGVHACLLDGEAVAAVLRGLQHPQKGVLRKGIALGGHGEADGRGLVPAGAVQALDPPLLFQEGDGVAQELLPLRGKLHAPVAAMEELDAQLLLQLPHRGGDAGLGEPQLMGRFVDGAAFENFRHIRQLLKCHAPPPPSVDEPRYGLV